MASNTVVAGTYQQFARMQFVPLEDGFEVLGCPTPGRLLDSFLAKKYDSLKILCERLVIWRILTLPLPCYEYAPMQAKLTTVFVSCLPLLSDAGVLIFRHFCVPASVNL